DMLMLLFRLLFASLSSSSFGRGDRLLHRAMTALFWVLGLFNVANGLWMLAAPAGWYEHLPAGVPDTGPLNLHFVRDIGAAFTTAGVALLAAAPAPERRRPVLLAVTLFYVLHAIIHVADIASG